MKRLAVLLGLVTVAAACEPNPVDLTTPSASTTAAANKVVIVGFSSTPGPAATALITAVGGTVRQRYKYIPAVSASIPSGTEDVLRADASVAYVEEDFAMVPLGTKQTVDWGVSKIDAPGAWALGFRGQGIKVGIFDSGIDVDHPDLAIAGGIDLVGDGNGLDDCNGHGTHVAGIVAARDGSRHTVGVAPSALLYSMRFADCDWAGATLEKMIQAVEWAIDNGMDVVN
ncbi:MAG TPA: S8 family serine peptidase, partial [Gemmatimonadales bacterium]|nr:S8 family serine peptidase [Gemmatimonadales bacterium]